MRLLFRTGTICLCIVSRILSWIFEVLLCKWSVILVFYCLLFYCVILVCSVCLYFVFFIIFVTEVFERLFLVCRFLIDLALWIHCVCSVSKWRGYYVKTGCPRCFDVEYTWSVCRNLAGGFFSTDVFWKLWLFFYAIN